MHMESTLREREEYNPSKELKSLHTGVLNNGVHTSL